MRRIVITALMACVAGAVATAADKKAEPAHATGLQAFIHGAPASPSEAWTLSAGGRIYDVWWDALDRKKPTTANPAYKGKREGATTWRCVECHGWDYKGKDGLYGSGERYSGAPGIRASEGADPKKIAEMLRKPPHNYTPDMIKDDELARVAAWVSRGQHDIAKYIDVKAVKAQGNARRGAALFQTTCAACHGFDGKALNWGTDKEPAYIGTEAKELPWEVLHKIRNAHPGAAMINFRALPMRDAVDVLTYAQSLPDK